MNGDLPEGWTAVSTKDLLKYVTSGSRGWARHYSADGALFLRISNLDHDTISIDLSEKKYVKPPRSSEGTRTRVRVGDLLISITADVGMVGLVQQDIGEAYINQHIALARPVEGINRGYLAWFIASTEGQTQLRALQRGATKVGLGLDDIKAVSVPFPPLNEQRRIVVKIDALLDKLRSSQARLDRIPAIIKRFRQAVLAAACSGRLTQDLRAGQVALRETTLGEVAAEIRTGPFGSALHKSDYVANGIPVINPVNMVAGKIVPSPEVSVSQATFRRLEDYVLRVGDVIIARRGEMGRCALVTKNGDGWLCGTGSAILRLKPEARSEYLALVISSPAARNYLTEASVGTTMDNLNQKLFKAMPIVLPPTEEQEEIIRRVTALYRFADRLQARYEKAIGQVDRLMQSILAKAFRGELVMTEAALAKVEGRSCETADELLARIQNQHAEPTTNGLARRVARASRRRRVEGA
jgi:type I restriction enzyme S subunit